MLDKDNLFEDIALTVDFDELPAEQQNEIVSYIEFIKNEENKESNEK